MTDDVRAVKNALDTLGPAPVLAALGIKHQREGRAARFCCPWHAERTPSATFRIGSQASLHAHCFGCGASSDALGLIAAVLGLDTRRDFRRVLEEAAVIAGVTLDPSAPPRERTPRPPPPPPPPPKYPTGAVDLWNRCAPVDADPECAAYLRSRRLDPAAVAARDLARALSPEGPWPGWARCRGVAWGDSGHRLLAACYDAHGALRSLRAARVRDGEGSKRLNPGGATTTGIVLACPTGRRLLAGDASPTRIVIAEGETDWLTACLAWPDLAILGIWAGAWTPDLAARIPDGAAVLVATDHDSAGDAYAGQITRSLSSRCDVRRFARKAAP